jgi:hypothetical protein
MLKGGKIIMNIWNKFKAGMDIGIKANISHGFIKTPEKKVYDWAVKWENNAAKVASKAAKK